MRFFFVPRICSWFFFFFFSVNTVVIICIFFLLLLPHSCLYVLWCSILKSLHHLTITWNFGELKMALELICVFVLSLALVFSFFSLYFCSLHLFSNEFWWLQTIYFVFFFSLWSQLNVVECVDTNTQHEIGRSFNS